MALKIAEYPTYMKLNSNFFLKLLCLTSDIDFKLLEIIYLL